MTLPLIFVSSALVHLLFDAPDITPAIAPNLDIILLHTMLHRFHLNLYKPDENHGSFGRDNLANERTFLAWIRTAMSFASVGIAVTHFFRYQSGQNMINFLLALTSDDPATRRAIEQLQVAVAANKRETAGLQRYLDLMVQHDKRVTKLATVLGSWFVATSFAVVVVGGYRYGISLKSLRSKRFPVSRWSIMLCLLVSLAVRDKKKTTTKKNISSYLFFLVLTG